MGFGQGKLMTVWKVDSKEKYSDVNISSFVIKENGLETDFSKNFVKFFYKAHGKIKDVTIPKGGVKIRLGECEVKTHYDHKTEQEYTNYSVFDFEFYEEENKDDNKEKKTYSKNTSKNSKTVDNNSDEEDELPFE